MTLPPTTLEPIVPQAEAFAAVRRDIHAHPELCFEEQRTSDLVARMLTEWGIPIHRGLGKTGLIGAIRNGQSSRAVGLRADMDGLPVTEFNTFGHGAGRIGNLPFASHHDEWRQEILSTQAARSPIISSKTWASVRPLRTRTWNA